MLSLDFDYIANCVRILDWFAINYPIDKKLKIKYTVFKYNHNMKLRLIYNNNYDYLEFEDCYFINNNPKYECFSSFSMEFTEGIIKNDILKEIYKKEIPQIAYDIFVCQYLRYKYFYNATDNVKQLKDKIAIHGNYIKIHRDFIKNLCERYNLKKTIDTVINHKIYKMFKCENSKAVTALIQLESY